MINDEQQARVDWKNLQPAVIVAAIALGSIGLLMLLFSLDLMPVFDSHAKGANIVKFSEKIFGIFFGCLLFAYAYKILADNRMTAYCWALVWFIFGMPFILALDTMLISNVARFVIFPVALLYYTENIWQLWKGARERTSKIEKLLCYILIIYDMAWVAVALKISGLLQHAPPP